MQWLSIFGTFKVHETPVAELMFSFLCGGLLCEVVGGEAVLLLNLPWTAGSEVTESGVVNLLSVIRLMDDF